jgi:hypothetical protein
LLAVAAAGFAAVAGALPLTAAALFVVGLWIGLSRPGAVAAFLALLLPIGFSVPTVYGVQVPLLFAAATGVGGGYAVRLVRARTVPGLEGPDLVFAALVAGVAISGAGPVGKPTWLHDLVLWASLALAFHCSVRGLAEWSARRLLYAALAVSAFAESVYAIDEYIQAAHSRFFRLGGAIVYPQPQATLQHPNSLGGFLALALLVLIGAALAERRSVGRLALVPLVVICFGVVAPFSRGGWISLAAGAGAFVAVTRHHRRLAGSIALTLVLAATAVAIFDRGPLGQRLTSLFHGHMGSLYGFRVTLARKAVDAIAHHPITGAGSFLAKGIYAGRLTVATHPHDLLLGVAVFFGLPSAAAFAALLVMAVRGALRASRLGEGRLAVEGAGTLGALVALLVNGILEYPFWNVSLTVEIVLVLTLAVALGRVVGASRDRTIVGGKPVRLD